MSRVAVEAVRPSPFALRLLVAAACIYGPFLIAPFAALLAGCETCRDSWIATFAILPGKLPAAMVADAFGAGTLWAIAPLSAGLIGVWMLMTAWCARECRAVPAFSATLSGSFAVVAVLAYAL